MWDALGGVSITKLRNKTPLNENYVKRVSQVEMKSSDECKAIPHVVDAPLQLPGPLPQRVVAHVAIRLWAGP